MWKLKFGAGKDPLLDSFNGFVGRQFWEFIEQQQGDEDVTQGWMEKVEAARSHFTNNRFEQLNSADLIMRLQFENKILRTVPDNKENAVDAALRKSIDFFASIQADDGHWPNDCGGITFLMCCTVFSLYVTRSINVVLNENQRHEMVRYLCNHQNEDGGWGMQIYSDTTMFGTCFAYISLRLLGQEADLQHMLKARVWILENGGAIQAPMWAKFWMAVLGVYDWSGVMPMLPELRLLSDKFPSHPGRLYCHSRITYMCMSYIYGLKFSMQPTNLVEALRREIYTQPYGKIRWSDGMNECRKEDVLVERPRFQKWMWKAISTVSPVFNYWPVSSLREKALSEMIEAIHYEDEASNYIGLSIMEKVISYVCCWVENPHSEAFRNHIPRFQDYFWLAEDGLKVNYCDGTQSWDAALSIQALIATGQFTECASMLKKAHYFLDQSQVRENCPGDFSSQYRHQGIGGWTLSTRDTGWVVSDCTAEALKAVLLLSCLPQELIGPTIPVERLYDSVDLIMSYQAPNGGVTTFEPVRSYPWMERINPIEIFIKSTVEHPCVECTSSCIQALAMFTRLHPGHREKEIARFINKGCDFIESQQNEDGSWFGFWGLCFTYGTWFCIEGLVAGGRESKAIEKGRAFLLSKQLPCGGWGESYLSSWKNVYINLPGERSNVVNTAWAMLGLLAAGQTEKDMEPLHRAANVLMETQLDNGDFPPQEMKGSFMVTGCFEYAGWRMFGPIKALAQYRQSTKKASLIKH